MSKSGTKKATIIREVVPEAVVYEMMDSEGEQMGLLKTNLPIDEIEQEWKKHYQNEEREEWGVSLFVEEMKKKHRASFYTFERVFCEATIYP